MPYTVSHAIVALPLSKISQRKIPVAALIIGSISPDYPYFLALSPTHAPGHSLVGVLVYCLVPSLIIACIWFTWIEKPTLEFWKLPIREDKKQNESFFVLVAGILIGAYSHVLWDATSHSYGAIAAQSELLQREMLNLPIYKWNQYLSGVLGLTAVLLWYTFTLVENSKAEYEGNIRLGLPIYIFSIAIFVVLGMYYRQSNSLVDNVVTVSITVVNGFVLGACVYAIWSHIQRDK